MQILYGVGEAATDRHTFSGVRYGSVICSRVVAVLIGVEMIGDVDLVVFEGEYVFWANRPGTSRLDSQHLLL